MGSYESLAFAIESFSARSSFGSFGIGAFFHNKVKTFIHSSEFTSVDLLLCPNRNFQGHFSLSSALDHKWSYPFGCAACKPLDSHSKTLPKYKNISGKVQYLLTVSATINTAVSEFILKVILIYYHYIIFMIQLTQKVNFKSHN